MAKCTRPAQSKTIQYYIWVTQGLAFRQENRYNTEMACKDHKAG